ncbi:MAG: hypothetical protein HQK54_12630 [Oligoflexales bacterium]|nr:hypothetical protein [Oligoflexales bacterium]
MIPGELGGNYSSICRCYVKLGVPRENEEEYLNFCARVKNREDFVETLSYFGAKQVGGEIGNVKEAVAFRNMKVTEKPDILVFTIPLTPSKISGIDYASLPILVKNMLILHGVIDEKINRIDLWPRVETITDFYNESSFPREKMEEVKLSNIPQGESLLIRSESKKMPESWNLSKEGTIDRIVAKKKIEDPLPWIIFCCSLIIGCMALEAGYGLIKRIIPIILRRREFLIIIFLGAYFFEDAFSAIQINLLGFPSGKYDAKTISHDVESRTSIDLDSAVLCFSELDSLIFRQPWIWASSINDLIVIDKKTQEKRLDERLVAWIKRGGFLVVENVLDTTTLDNLTKEVFFRNNRDGIWSVIPPDHELMRSFHLLDSLLTCKGQLWRGFHYDGRLAILAIPFPFILSVLDNNPVDKCFAGSSREQFVRTFINILMVTLTTDYKKDQIHLPEILKRLR